MRWSVVCCRVEELGLAQQAEAAIVRFARDDTVAVKVAAAAAAGGMIAGQLADRCDCCSQHTVITPFVHEICRVAISESGCGTDYRLHTPADLHLRHCQAWFKRWSGCWARTSRQKCSAPDCRCGPAPHRL